MKRRIRPFLGKKKEAAAVGATAVEGIAIDPGEFRRILANAPKVDLNCQTATAEPLKSCDASMEYGSDGLLQES